MDGQRLKVGMVCPYSFEEPGGVQAHAIDLCQELRRRGHHVSLIGPGGSLGKAGPAAAVAAGLPDFVELGAGSVRLKYNGSVARLSFGRKVAKHLRQWITEGEFDVVHIHEPNSPSYSLQTLMVAEGPIVATYHAAATESRLLRIAWPLLHPYLERIQAGIAVSEEARRWQVQNLAGDPVLIPNGVDTAVYRDAQALPRDTRPTIMFLGRFDEPRKGLDILLNALPDVLAQVPDARLVIAGGGDEERLHASLMRRNLSFVSAPAAVACGGGAAGLESAADRDTVAAIAAVAEAKVVVTGRVSEEEKAQLLASSDLYIAPNTGGESFGIVLVEAMAAGTAVVASDIPAFAAVTQEGQAGALFENRNSRELAEVITKLLIDIPRREAAAARGSDRARDFDWDRVASEVESVYATAVTPGRKVTLL